ncbi:MAG: ABC transporter ATP-binding protein [Clostridia bacterium]|nr:ABC transporter ATP-binding protein [Clostridia bacterium]
MNEIIDEELLIDARDICMKFRLPTERIDNAKEYFIKLLKRRLKYVDFDVLKGVTLQVKKGESLGLIGRNGAGKSTLLRILAGIMEPTSGSVVTHGNMVPLLKLGAGFDMDATGEENIYLNGAMLGYTHKEMKEKYDGIVEFSELGKFMKTPLKNYSQGMLSRLGFSIAVDVHPDILLIDEILAVGDAPFQKKCAQKLDELKAGGTTFIVVSHSNAQIRRLCTKAIYLKDGVIVDSGDADAVVRHYEKDCAEA